MPGFVAAFMSESQNVQERTERTESTSSSSAVRPSHIRTFTAGYSTWMIGAMRRVSKSTGKSAVGKHYFLRDHVSKSTGAVSVALSLLTLSSSSSVTRYSCKLYLYASSLLDTTILAPT